MGERRKSRESALQILFQLEFVNNDLEKIINQYWKNRKSSEKVKNYANWLVKGVISSREKIDKLIKSSSEHWRLPRMAVVDRNILRIAVFEFLFERDVPPPVIINEAIEIAKKYSTEEAGQFVNGILDGIKKKIEEEKWREDGGRKD
ncbi:MAG: transcription antitermination factor NusB [Candidatus Aminicenantia bacterium]